MDKTIIIIGYSGHAYTVLDIALKQNLNVLGYIDKDEKESNPFDLKFLGGEENLNSESYIGFPLFVAIGDNTIRKKVTEKHTNLYEFTILKHVTSIVNSKCFIGKGSMIAAGAILNPYVKIGEGTIVNTGAIIEHECIVGDYSHIAPGAVLAGNVTVGNLCFIGANSVVKQGVSIGNNVTIGAGAVVLKDIPDNETWVGNPAKKIK